MDRQKLLLIFGGAWVSAALLTWFLYARTKAPQTEKIVKVVAAARDLPAGTRLRKGDLKAVSMVERDTPRGAILDERLLADRVLLFPVSNNEPVLSGKVAALVGAEGVTATIDAGKRAISVQITDSSGVSGLIQPRAHVDVLFTRTGSMTEAVTNTILEDVVVLAIGRATESQAIDPKQRSTAQTATLLVSPEEAQKLELAKNQGKISLALRNPLDRSKMESNEGVGAEVLDPMIFARRGPRGRTLPGRAALKDPKAWAQLTAEDEAPPKPKVEKKEPPKPRAVVDVYRGDKHVQEIFH